MSYRKDAFVEGEFYHVYNRGNSKQLICKDKSDFVRVQELMYLCNDQSATSIKDARRRKDGVFNIERQQPIVAIGAYCVMPNHYHMLVTPLVEGGLSQFMLKIGTGYAMYFNKKYDRSGSLFEGKFKAKRADTDRYLKYLFSYIHLNPIAKFPRQGLGQAVAYEYSSLRDHFGETRDEGMILQTDKFPEYFLTLSAKKNELNEWLQYSDSDV